MRLTYAREKPIYFICQSLFGLLEQIVSFGNLKRKALIKVTSQIKFGSLSSAAINEGHNRFGGIRESANFCGDIRDGS